MKWPGGPSFRNRNIISPRSRNPLCTKSDKSESSSKQKTICTKITLIHTQFQGSFIISTLTNHFTYNFVTTQIPTILQVQCTIFHINNSQQILLKRMLGRRFLATSSRHSHNITAHYLLSHRYSESVSPYPMPSGLVPLPLPPVYGTISSPNPSSRQKEALRI